jgi:sugar/nucleoside kinase (ribokinase family)
MTASVVCVGDVMLDVIVNAPSGLVPDDDTPAAITFDAGGQAPNVAAWVVASGGNALVVGPRCARGHGPLVTSMLQARGVEVRGPTVERAGAVMSLVQAGTRSMASDAGDTTWLTRLEPADLPGRMDWLFVSGYVLLRSPTPSSLTSLVAAARDRGARVAVDLASAAAIDGFGSASFSRLCESLSPDVVLGNDAEWAALSRSPGAVASFAPGGRTVLVLKHGPRGASFVIDGIADDRPAAAGPVVDPTGAGDALAAGYLVGGVDVAMATAARCVGRVGAQPGSLP